MNITNVISSVRSAWAASLPSIPLHLQLGPENARPPFAVMRVGTISPGEGDLTERDYETSLTLVTFTTNDAACLAAMDIIDDTFDRGRMAGIYVSTLGAATFDLNYTDNAALWSSEISYSLRWTKSIS
jgi:hypothetical protein